MRSAIAFAALCVWLATSSASAAGPTPESAPAEIVATVADAPPTEPPGVARALVICGLTGDEDHRKLFAETAERLYAGLTTHHGFQPEYVHILWSDEAVETDGQALRSSRRAPTREVIESTIANLAKDIQADDRLWIFVLGHAHYDGRYSWLNLPGPDMNHVELGKLLADVRCREQAFFITTPASGFYHRSLAAPGRIVITATEPDLEVNETLFPHHLAKALVEPPPFQELDLDEDGQLTLLDAYLWTCQEVAREYATNMLLATEHALLDDSGDGRGTEIQADYLSEELGGRRRAGRQIVSQHTADGALARKITLRFKERRE